MGMFGQKPYGYYTNQTQPRDAINIATFAPPPPQPLGANPIGMDQTIQDLPTDPRVAASLHRGMFGNKKAIGIIGDILAGLGGREGKYLPTLAEQKKSQQEQQRLALEQQFKMAELATKLHTPQIVNAGNGRVLSVDPATNDTTEISPLTPAPDQGAIYASHFGAEGSPAWVKAYQDFHLRGNSPDALAAREQSAIGLIDYRNAHRPPSASGGKPASIRSVGGKAYYKVNGRWYDNPEGR